MAADAQQKTICTVPHPFAQLFHTCSLLNNAAAAACATFNRRRSAFVPFVQPAVQPISTRWQRSLEATTTCDRYQRLQLMCCSCLPSLVSFRLASAEVKPAYNRSVENRIAAHIIRRCVSVVAVRLFARYQVPVDFWLVRRANPHITEASRTESPRTSSGAASVS